MFLNINNSLDCTQENKNEIKTKAATTSAPLKRKALCDITNTFPKTRKLSLKDSIDRLFMKNNANNKSTNIGNHIELKSFPIDLTLKKIVRFNFDNPLTIYFDPKIITKSTNDFVARTTTEQSNNFINDNINKYNSTLSHKLHTACYFWSFNLSSSIIHTSDKDWDIWEETYRSAYYSLINQNKYSHLYLHSNKFFVIFSKSTNDKEKDVKQNKINVVFTRSSQNLRNRLISENIEFSMPLSKSRNTFSHDDSVIFDELSQFEKSGGKIQIYADINKNLNNENEYNSLLLFTKKTSVHSIFDYILNNHKKLFSFNPPKLYSTFPFENSSLSKIKINYKKTKRITPKISDSYIVELIGPIMPLNLSNISNIFKENIPEFNGEMISYNEATGLNKIKNISEDDYSNQFLYSAAEYKNHLLIYGISSFSFRDDSFYIKI